MAIGYSKRKVLLVLLFAATTWLASCGNPRPPEPPSLELPRRVRDLRASRKGNNVYLTWTKPQRTTEGETILYLGPTRICRGLAPMLHECGTPAGELSPAPRSSSSSLKASSKPSLQVHISQATDGSYTDILSTSNVSDPNAEYTYALEVLNQAQRSAGLSNQVHVPAVPTLPPPADFQAKLTSSGVLLSWAVPSSFPSDTNALQHVIRIYRQEQNPQEEKKDQKPNRDVIIAALPLSMSQYLDTSFEWEKTYSYHATVMSVVRSAGCSNTKKAAECKTEYIEGDDNPSVTLFAHDVFPPAMPTGLQAVFGGSAGKLVMDLVWNPDIDSDLAGYNVYRQEPGEEWMKVNSGLVKTSAYHDETVAAGKTYNYSVSAVDVHGNQSARSASAQETVPAQP